MEPTWWSLLLGRLLLLILAVIDTGLVAIFLLRAKVMMGLKQGLTPSLTSLSKASMFAILLPFFWYGAIVGLSPEPQNSELAVPGVLGGFFLVMTVLLSCIVGYVDRKLDLPLAYPLVSVRGALARVISLLFGGMAACLLVALIIVLVATVFGGYQLELDT